ncbi:MAG: HDOD domain-containing protein [Myxococcota bacterium]|jgi:putative nucleotidyltransferase with HDIG domain|nr:HDOD domain-containing protein [Myxococcota bacterium]
MSSKEDPVLIALDLLGDLPTLPNVAIEVAGLLDDPRSTPKQITEVMKADQALTSKVLKLVNSAYYGIPGGVSTVERAIAFLGYNTLFQLLIGVSVLEFSRIGGASGLDIREFWKHSLGVGVAAEMIARRLGHKAPEDMFSGGLLHDLGKLALAKVAKKKFASAVEEAHKQGKLLRDMEKEQGLPPHDKVGAILAKKWRFPPALQAAMAAHHQTYDQRQVSVLKAHLTGLDIVDLANRLVRVFDIGNSGDPVIPEIPRDLLDRLGLLAKDIPNIKGEMTRKVEASKVFLDLLADDL